MGSPRVVLVIFALGACARTASPAPHSAVDVRAVGSGAALPSLVAPAQGSIFHVASTTCPPGAICPIYPEFPQILEMYVEGDRVCLRGLDREGCLGADGWELTVRPAAESRRRAPAEKDLESDKPPASRLERSPRDVWKWTANEISHFDGVRTETLEVPSWCWRSDGYGESVASASRAWFTICDADAAGGHDLVEVDLATGRAARKDFPHVIGLALDARGEVVASGWESGNEPLRRRVYDADGALLRNAPAPDNKSPRVGFPDGAFFAFDVTYFDEVHRFDGNAWKTVLRMPSSGHAFHAMSSHDFWAGGLELYRWHDGTTTKVKYRAELGAMAEAIGASASDDVWIASSRSPQMDLRIRLSHWDGKRWSQHDLPDAERDPKSLAVVSPSEAWFLSAEHLWRWNGHTWVVAHEVVAHAGFRLTLTPQTLWITGNSSIYRMAR